MNEKNCQDFCPTVYRAEILTILRLYFGRNDDLVNSFRNLPTFSQARLYYILVLDIFKTLLILQCTFAWFDALLKGPSLHYLRVFSPFLNPPNPPT